MDDFPVNYREITGLDTDFPALFCNCEVNEGDTPEISILTIAATESLIQEISSLESSSNPIQVISWEDIDWGLPRLKCINKKPWLVANIFGSGGDDCEPVPEDFFPSNNLEDILSAIEGEGGLPVVELDDELPVVEPDEEFPVVEPDDELSIVEPDEGFPVVEAFSGELSNTPPDNIKWCPGGTSIICGLDKTVIYNPKYIDLESILSNL